MIPFAAVACLADTPSGQLECSLTDLSALGFTFRVPHRWDALMGSVTSFTLCFHRFDGDHRCTLAADIFTLTRETCEADFVLWRVETIDAAYRAAAQRFMAEYSRYIELKLAGDDAQLTAALTGHTTDEGTAATFAAQRAAWLADCHADDAWAEALAAIPELAVSLSTPALWEAFLTLTPEAFLAWYWQSHGLTGHPLTARSFDCVYIGNEFCPQLFPDAATLAALLDRAEALRLRPVVVLAPVTEGRYDAASQLLDTLVPRAIEIVVNDWGTAQLVHTRPALTLTLGILLQKRRKDVRMAWIQDFGGHGDQLAENAENAPFYREWLRAQGFARYSAEACGYPIQPGAVCLHLPFYQTNTATRCTLAARCERGDRGLQVPHSTCPRWCLDRAFLYPDALRMVGRWNSLFGLDARALTDGAYLRSLTGGTSRLVIDLL